MPSKLNKTLRMRKKRVSSGSSLGLKDHVGLHGQVTIHAYDRGGNTIYKQTNRPNLLMYNERDILIELLGGILLGSPTYAQDNGGLTGDGNRRYLKWFGLGDGTTAPVRTDTALDSQLGDLLLVADYASGSTPTKVSNALQFDLTIPFTDSGGDVDTNLNGNVISEIGLFTIASDENGAGQTGNEVMFSRQVHPGITKTSAVQIDYTYQIIFT